MAHDKSIDELERDVEQARARVAADIAMLRAPETYEAAKSSLMDSAFGYRDRMRDRATGYGDGMIETLKAKAAANPLAVAAIGAGIAWRLYRYPPISAALVGLGVASLLRTDPEDDSMHPRRLLAAASEKAMELKDRVAAQVSEIRDDAVGALEDRRRELAVAAEGAYEAATDRMKSMGSTSPGDGTTAAFQETGDPEALGVRKLGMRAPTADIPYREADVRSHRAAATGDRRRDAYLLGVAALAVGAAVGLSRRHGAQDIADDVERDEFDNGREVMWRRY